MEVDTALEAAIMTRIATMAIIRSALTQAMPLRHQALRMGLRIPRQPNSYAQEDR